MWDIKLKFIDTHSSIVGIIRKGSGVSRVRYVVMKYDLTLGGDTACNIQVM